MGVYDEGTYILDKQIMGVCDKGTNFLDKLIVDICDERTNFLDVQTMSLSEQITTFSDLQAIVNSDVETNVPGMHSIFFSDPGINFLALQTMVECYNGTHFLNLQALVESDQGTNFQNLQQMVEFDQETNFSDIQKIKDCDQGSNFQNLQPNVESDQGTSVQNRQSMVESDQGTNVQNRQSVVESDQGTNFSDIQKIKDCDQGSNFQNLQPNVESDQGTSVQNRQSMVESDQGTNVQNRQSVVESDQGTHFSDIQKIKECDQGTCFPDMHKMSISEQETTFHEIQEIVVSDPQNNCAVNVVTIAKSTQGKSVCSINSLTELRDAVTSNDVVEFDSCSIISCSTVAPSGPFKEIFIEGKTMDHGINAAHSIHPVPETENEISCNTTNKVAKLTSSVLLSLSPESNSSLLMLCSPILVGSNQNSDKQKLDSHVHKCDTNNIFGHNVPKTFTSSRATLPHVSQSVEDCVGDNFFLKGFAVPSSLPRDLPNQVEDNERDKSLLKGFAVPSHFPRDLPSHEEDRFLLKEFAMPRDLPNQVEDNERDQFLLKRFVVPSRLLTDLLNQTETLHLSSTSTAEKDSAATACSKEIYYNIEQAPASYHVLSSGKLQGAPHDELGESSRQTISETSDMAELCIVTDESGKPKLFKTFDTTDERPQENTSNLQCSCVPGEGQLHLESCQVSKPNIGTSVGHINQKSQNGFIHSKMKLKSSSNQEVHGRNLHSLYRLVDLYDKMLDKLNSGCAVDGKSQLDRFEQIISKLKMGQDKGMRKLVSPKGRDGMNVWRKQVVESQAVMDVALEKHELLKQRVLAQQTNAERVNCSETSIDQLRKSTNTNYVCSQQGKDSSLGTLCSLANQRKEADQNELQGFNEVHSGKDSGTNESCAERFVSPSSLSHLGRLQGKCAITQMSSSSSRLGKDPGKQHMRSTTYNKRERSSACDSRVRSNIRNNSERSTRCNNSVRSFTYNSAMGSSIYNNPEGTLASINPEGLSTCNNQVNSACNNLVNSFNVNNQVNYACNNLVNSSNVNNQVNFACNNLVNSSNVNNQVNSACNNLVNSSNVNNQVNSACNNLVNSSNVNNQVNSACNNLVNSSNFNDQVNSTCNNLVISQCNNQVDTSIYHNPVNSSSCNNQLTSAEAIYIDNHNTERIENFINSSDINETAMKETSLSTKANFVVAAMIGNVSNRHCIRDSNRLVLPTVQKNLNVMTYDTNKNSSHCANNISNDRGGTKCNSSLHELNNTIDLRYVESSTELRNGVKTATANMLTADLEENTKADLLGKIRQKDATVVGKDMARLDANIVNQKEMNIGGTEIVVMNSGTVHPEFTEHADALTPGAVRNLEIHNLPKTDLWTNQSMQDLRSTKADLNHVSQTENPHAGSSVSQILETFGTECPGSKRFMKRGREMESSDSYSGKVQILEADPSALTTSYSQTQPYFHRSSTRVLEDQNGVNTATKSVNFILPKGKSPCAAGVISTTATSLTTGLSRKSASTGGTVSTTATLLNTGLSGMSPSICGSVSTTLSNISIKCDLTRQSHPEKFISTNFTATGEEDKDKVDAYINNPSLTNSHNMIPKMSSNTNSNSLNPQVSFLTTKSDMQTEVVAEFIQSQNEKSHVYQTLPVMRQSKENMYTSTLSKGAFNQPKQNFRARPISPTSTISSSLFPVSSKEIMRRMESRLSSQQSQANVSVNNSEQFQGNQTNKSRKYQTFDLKSTGTDNHYQTFRLQSNGIDNQGQTFDLTSKGIDNQCQTYGLQSTGIDNMANQTHGFKPNINQAKLVNRTPVVKHSKLSTQTPVTIDVKPNTDKVMQTSLSQTSSTDTILYLQAEIIPCVLTRHPDNLTKVVLPEPKKRGRPSKKNLERNRMKKVKCGHITYVPENGGGETHSLLINTSNPPRNGSNIQIFSAQVSENIGIKSKLDNTQQLLKISQAGLTVAGRVDTSVSKTPQPQTTTGKIHTSVPKTPQPQTTGKIYTSMSKTPQPQTTIGKIHTSVSKTPQPQTTTGRIHTSVSKTPHTYLTQSGSIDVSLLISGLHSVQLIADEEVTGTSKDFPPDFWNEEFADIRMSQSFWNVLDTW